MPSQTPPFFASFFGAFGRARTNPAFQAKSSVASSSISPSSLTASAHVSTTTATTTAVSSTSRSITTTTVADTTAQPLQTSSQSIPTVANKPATNFPTAFTSTSPGTHTPFYHPKSSGSSSPVPHNANISMSPPGTSTPLTRGRQRRGSDSSNSSGGFMDALGSEKWYVGGRTAGGDERFYRLGLVTAGAGKRTTSLDRLSL